MQAAFEGAREIGFTILSMTLSLAAVFIPVLFMGGIMGRLFHEFAVTIMVRDPDLGLRLAEPHADAVQPLSCGRPGRDQNRALPRVGARLRRHARRLRLDPARRHPPSPRHHAGRRRNTGRHRLSATASCPRASFPTRTPASSPGSPRRRRTSRSRRWCSSSSRSRRDPRRRPEHRGILVERRRRRHDERPATPGRLFIRLKPRAERARHARAGDRGAAAQAERDSRHPHLSAESAAGPHRRAGEPEPLPVHPAGSGHRGAVSRGRRRSKTQMREIPGLIGREQRPADLPARRSTWTSTASAPPRWASPPTRSRTRSTTRTARARSPRSTPPIDDYWVIMELLPKYQRDPDRARPAVRRLRQRASWCRCPRWRSCGPASGR